MKKVEREIYQILANEVDFNLCAFCKYAEFSGSCCEADIDCAHPLVDKSWGFEKQVERANELGDCWGFRPRHKIDFIADIIGQTLAHGWDGGVSWWQDENGNWRITGSKLVNSLSG